jgi:GntR family transcriptional repressor for pyruvate dehydrogenase complex
MTDEIPLERIRSARISDAAVEQITSLIESGHIKIGDRLPSERELIKRLGVSRTSVREALRMLEAQGILEVQPGRGAFVISDGRQTDFLAPMLNWLRDHQRDMLDIVEVREAIETKAVFLAAQRVGDGELQKLEAVLEEMEQHNKHGEMDKVSELDRVFHRLLCDASGNNFLRMLADNIVQALAEPRYSILVVPGRAQVSLSEHRAILEALRAGDPDLAVSAMFAHMQSVKRALSSLPVDGHLAPPQ